MHELGGLFCKTGDLWINRKNVQAEKNIELGRNWPAQREREKKRRGRWPHPSGLGPGREGEAGRGRPAGAGPKAGRWPARG